MVNVRNIVVAFPVRVTRLEPFESCRVEGKKFAVGVIIDGMFCVINDANRVLEKYRVLEKDEETRRYDINGVNIGDTCVTSVIRFWENNMSQVSAEDVKFIVLRAEDKIIENDGYNKQDFISEPETQTPQTSFGARMKRRVQDAFKKIIGQ